MEERLDPGDSDLFRRQQASPQPLPEAHGKDKLRQLYGGLQNRLPREKNSRRFQEALGISVEQADEALQAWLAGR
jgi:hypothetical protein